MSSFQFATALASLRPTKELAADAAQATQAAKVEANASLERFDADMATVGIRFDHGAPEAPADEGKDEDTAPLVASSSTNESAAGVP